MFKPLVCGVCYGSPWKLELGARAGKGGAVGGKDYGRWRKGEEESVTWERGDMFWEKRKSGGTYFLVLISLEFKILRKTFV